MPPIQAESTAAVVTWVLDTLATPFLKKVKQVADDQIEKARWKEATEKYLNSILKHYGTVPVLGQSQAMKLDEIFTDVYILDKPSALLRYDIQHLQEKGEERFRSDGSWAKRVKGIGLVNQHKDLYILGKPGAGKTTFMKHIATQAAQGRFIQKSQKRSAEKLPIFVSLHEWATSDHRELFDFIVQEFDTCHFPEPREFVEYLLQAGRGLLLFDGLDEVKREDDLRQEVTQQLRRFIRKYDRCQYLITCRVAASDYNFPGFDNVEVADFTDEQIQAYAEMRFDEAAKYEAFVDALAEEQHKAVRELCNTPLLLSLVCLYFDENMVFPQRRSELYKEALDILLRKWDSQRNLQRDVIFYGKLPPQRKQQMLAHIATPAFEKGQLFWRKEELGREIANYLSKLPGIQQEAADIDGEEVLREIAAQNGLLVERATNIYSFSHLTFQEYFTARYITENESRGTTQALIRDHLTDRRWREIMLLVVSMLDEGDDFCQLMRLEMDNRLTVHEKLVEMLAWSEERTQVAKPTSELVVTIRLAYVSLARALDLARALALALDLARDVHPQVGLDYGLYYTWAISAILGRVGQEKYQEVKDDYATNFSQLFELCEMAQADDLLAELQQLSVPQAGLSSSPASWQKLADELSQLMVTHRDLRMDWSLDQTEWDAMNDYFYANELLVRCLDLAFVQDRQGFKEGLLLPPGEWEKRMKVEG